MHLASFEERGSIKSPSHKPQEPPSALQELISLRKQELLGLMSAPAGRPSSFPDSISDASGNNDLYTFLKRRQAEEESAQERELKRQRTVNEQGNALANFGLFQGGGGANPNSSFLQGQNTNLGDTQASLTSNFFINDQFMRAELRARQYQQDIAANRNALMMASLLGKSQGQSLNSYPSILQQQQQQHNQLLDGFMQRQLSGSFGGSHVDSLLTGLMTRGQPNQGMSASDALAQQLHQSRPAMLPHSPVDMNAVLRHLTWPVQSMDVSQGLEGVARANAVSTVAPQGNHHQQGLGSIRLPPCEEGIIRPFTEREKFPLGVDEDPNWLSEFHCFVRSELVEICRASHDDCKSRNNATSYQQVGIRCRFCAHKPPTGRGCRSSAYPSSIRQIYQSFTMMLRDHFGSCDAMPEDTKKRFLALKDKPSQGATDSKRYWMYSAMKAGLADSPDGIIINHNTFLAGISAPPFGSESPAAWQREAMIACPLVTQADGNLGTPFLRCLLTQAHVVQLRESERIGNRRSLDQGLPGFSCRFCWEKRRLGLCRMFPARRRTLSQKLMDLYDHLCRCQATPDTVKEELERHKRESNEENLVDSGDTKALLDRIWARLGHGNS